MNEKLTKDHITNKLKEALLEYEKDKNVEMSLHVQQKIDNRNQEGPWDNEPDKFSFIDEVTKLECIILRSKLGSLCGYVVFPEGKDLDIDLLEVHGGVTYSDYNSLCDNKYCIGFDCAHYSDWSPYMMSRLFANEANATYKDIEFVKAECIKLAKQLYDLRESKK